MSESCTTTWVACDEIPTIMSRPMQGIHIQSRWVPSAYGSHGHGLGEALMCRLMFLCAAMSGRCLLRCVAQRAAAATAAAAATGTAAATEATTTPAAMAAAAAAASAAAAATRGATTAASTTATTAAAAITEGVCSWARERSFVAQRAGDIHRGLRRI